MSYPTHLPAPYGAVVYQNQTLSYEFRVVEHVNDEGKVTAYIMQTQIWAHNPPDASGIKPMPILLQDWTDVPRVQMQNGKILTAPQKKSPPPFSQATVQKLTSNGGTNTVLKSNGSAGTWSVNPTTFETQYEGALDSVSKLLGRIMK